MIDLAFESGVPTFSSEFAVTFFNADLDDAQRMAVERALHADDLAIIHGPPGKYTCD